MDLDLELAEQRWRLRSLTALILGGVLHTLLAASVLGAAAYLHSFSAVDPVEVGCIVLPVGALALAHGLTAVLTYRGVGFARIIVFVLIAIDLVFALGCVSSAALCLFGLFGAMAFIA